MPLYEYKCVKCGHRFEKIESHSASAVKKCPKCGAKAERMIGAPAIQFKGTGWYVTDYAGKKPSSSGKDGGESGAAKSDDKAEAKPAAEKSTEKASGKSLEKSSKKK